MPLIDNDVRSMRPFLRLLLWLGAMQNAPFSDQRRSSSMCAVNPPRLRLYHSMFEGLDPRQAVREESRGVVEIYAPR